MKPFPFSAAPPTTARSLRLTVLKLVGCAFITARAWAQPDPVPLSPQTNFAFPTPKTYPSISSDQLSQLVGGPTLVTYSSKGMHASDFARLLFPDSPQVQVYSRPEGVDVDWHEVPYWTAVRKAEDLLGMSWSLTTFNSGFGEQRHTDLNLLTQYRWGAEGPLAADTPFVRIELNGLFRESTLKHLSKSGPDAPILGDHHGRMEATVYIDPKLDYVTSELRVSQAEDVNGRKTFLPVNGDLPFPNSSQWDAFHFKAELPPGLGPSTRLSRIKGSLRLKLITGSKVWKLDDVQSQAPAKLGAGDIEASFEGANWDGHSLKLDLGLMRPVDQTQFYDFGAVRLLFSRIVVRDAAGQVLDLVKSETKDGATQGSGLGPPVGGKYPSTTALTFAASSYSKPAAGPFSVEWRIPLDFRIFDTPFEVRNVIMP